MPLAQGPHNVLTASSTRSYGVPAGFNVFSRRTSNCKSAHAQDALTAHSKMFDQCELKLINNYVID